MPPQKRKKRKIVVDEEPTISPPSLIPGPIPGPIPISSSTPYDKYIIQEQDEDYEMAIIMDMIKMQENEEKKKEEEREKEKKIQEEKRIEELNQRDRNVKEILRKIKTGSILSSIEKTIIHLLEAFMESLETKIILHDSNLYEEIFTYLGIDGRKGTIRVSNEIKEFAKNSFTLL